MMKQVGEAVRDFILSCSHKEGEIVTIGIATWGTVYNRESLICPMVSQAKLEMHLLCLCLDCRGCSAKDRGGNGCFEMCRCLAALVKPSRTRRSDGPRLMFAEKPLYPTQCVAWVLSFSWEDLEQRQRSMGQG